MLHFFVTELMQRKAGRWRLTLGQETGETGGAATTAASGNGSVCQGKGEESRPQVAAI